MKQILKFSTNYPLPYEFLRVALLVAVLFGVGTKGNASSMVFHKEIIDTSSRYKFFKHSREYNPGRSKAVSIGTATFGGGLLFALGTSWYGEKGFDQFTFFDDKLEWRGMDKLGHAVTAFQVCEYVNNWYQWSGRGPRNAAVLSGITAGSFLTAVEVLDGFGEGWGFSWLDMTTNAAGVGLHLLKHGSKGRIKPLPYSLKYNYYPSSYRAIRPDLLGENEITALIKDYNAQQYWFSWSFNQWKRIEWLPSWIAVSVGYSADGMLGGDANPVLREDGTPYPNFSRTSSFMLSLDVDWTRIRTKNALARFALRALSFYKIPFPSVGINSKGKLVHSYY